MLLVSAVTIVSCKKDEPQQKEYTVSGRLINGTTGQVFSSVKINLRFSVPDTIYNGIIDSTVTDNNGNFSIKYSTLPASNAKIWLDILPPNNIWTGINHIQWKLPPYENFNKDLKFSDSGTVVVTLIYKNKWDLGKDTLYFGIDTGGSGGPNRVFSDKLTWPSTLPIVKTYRVKWNWASISWAKGASNFNNYSSPFIRRGPIGKNDAEGNFYPPCDPDTTFFTLEY